MRSDGRAFPTVISAGLAIRLNGPQKPCPLLNVLLVFLVPPPDFHKRDEAERSTGAFSGCPHGRFSNAAFQQVKVWIGFDTYFS